MATVRNIRNLLLAGISSVHVRKVCNYISNETAVSRGKMFPFQYFTAYDILNEVKEIKEGKNEKKFPKKNDQDKEKKEKEKWMIEKEKKREAMIGNINLEHVKQVQKALDTAVNIAARRNIPPLKGTTLILCQYSLDMMQRFTAAKGVSHRGATIRDAAALFSLMCHQASEDGHLALFSQTYQMFKPTSHDLLSNVEAIKQDSDVNKKVGQSSFDNCRGQGVLELLKDYIQNEKKLDNIIMFSGGLDSAYIESVYEQIRLYRKYVNKKTLFANVNICAHPSEALDENELFTDQNDLNIFGFSDSIFNLIINKGNGGQLQHVENIDKKYNLVKISSPLTDTKLTTPTISDVDIPIWQDVRVFISSTFLDMESERNILHQFVLPQLQRRAAEKFINVDFIDLRWGLSEEVLRSRNEVELCLEQIKKCQLFIGILGHRYGWIPDQQVINSLTYENEEFKKQVSNRGFSMTQLEMEFGVLNSVEEARNRAFFYLRNVDTSNSFNEDLFESQNLSTQRIISIPKTQKVHHSVFDIHL